MKNESQIFVGRQPILDRNQKVIAYELLFRGSAMADSAVFAEQGVASLRVIVNTFMSMGIVFPYPPVNSFTLKALSSQLT